MALEIERKFLVRNEEWGVHVRSKIVIRQAYLALGEHSSTRVRIVDDSHATITIKSRGAKLSRLEVESSITVADAEALLLLRERPLIEKTRHIVPWQGLIWEIDVFAGENLGLIIAEVELRHEHQSVARPPWIGAEVTGQSQYYNGSLARRPYSQWRPAA